jgi:DNA modification methylase
MPGDLIVDPYCGSGTVPAAWRVLGRRWQATGQDRATALVARKRLAQKGGKKDGEKRAGRGPALDLRRAVGGR